jgi:very-short-patch-repair endonuclease
MTPTEELVLHLRAMKIQGWELEHRFHKKRRWRLDIAWPDAKVAVEVHGGVYAGGRHTRGPGFTADREKMNEAQLLGWTVLEVTTEQVRSGQALEWVERALGLSKQKETLT